MLSKARISHIRDPKEQSNRSVVRSELRCRVAVLESLAMQTSGLTVRPREMAYPRKAACFLVEIY